ncbi:hypothetical protein EH240_33505 [Mesorhizobium tamadayense]|uniref:Helix-turn-helix domain-containing protein n=1 Tax=Mesorhizobium tamadayense TaxID=425306 RepID=A0A3P3EV50_9HYPH|nr:hypothetical protein [Mesorhizobium tamadayense]RRH90047.1 hypothetical protein EH240_33505 [Mesorhizobium tamadayense]
MSEAKEPRTVKPGSLLSQWWTLGAIAIDSRTAGRHMTVAWVIIDRYMQSKGGSRASLRYIEKATGLSKPTVIGACRELVDWGYFTRHLGEGTRPSEYGPEWLVVNPSLPQASGQQGFTTGGQDGLTTTAASGQQGFTKDLLTSPADKPADSKVGNEDTPDTPAHGLAASAGSRDPFDRFWQSYPRKYQKPKVRAAWDKLAPDADMAERIIDAAARWADHYQANPVDKKWIPAPANWLAGERFDEDLPSVYVDAKEAAIAKAKDKPKKPAVADNDNAEVEWVGDVSAFVPAGRHVIRIKDAWYHVDGDNHEATLVFDVDDQNIVLTDVEHCFFVQHQDENVQIKGQRHLNDACNSAGIADIQDIEEFIGKDVEVIVGKDGSIRYIPVRERKAA